jgi:hypothetical protein
VNELKARLSKLRLVQIAIIASIPMFGWVAEISRDPGNSGWTLKHWLVTGLALWALAGGSRVHHRMLIRSEQELAKDALIRRLLNSGSRGTSLEWHLPRASLFGG